MSSSSFEAGESSRAREQPERDEVVQFQPRPWVALSSIPVVLGANNERAPMLVPGASDFLLDLQPPLVGASYLVLPERIVPDPRSFSFPYVISACPDRILFMATRGDRVWNYAYFLADPDARTAARLPDVPAHLGFNTFPRRSIGLIADPRHGGHYMVAQLHPSSTTRHTTLLCYSTVTDQWTARPLASSPDHEPWAANGVLAHDGLLWWIDNAYGMLVCDPSADDDDLHLRFIPLPVGCQMQGFGHGERVRLSALMDQRRVIRPSQGKLRYVEIVGVPYPVGPAANQNQQPPVNPQVRMFTLVSHSQEGQHHWVHEYTATFADIWGHHSYADAGLPLGVVPSLALVDPNSPNILYFFQDTTLFAVDVHARQVLRRLEYAVDSAFGELRFQNPRFVDAWQLPPALLVNGDAPDGGSGSRGPDDEETDGSDSDEIASLLSQMEIKSEPDREQASPDPELLSMPEDRAPPSGSSPDAGDQAADAGDQAADSGDQADAEP